MVAIAGLLLVYVTAPVLSLVGLVVILNDASPYSLALSTTNEDVENVDGPGEILSGLLVLVEDAY